MRKIINLVVLFLVSLLVVLPLLFFFITNISGIPVLDSERLVIHTVFIFACFAGIITSAEKKQLSIEAFLSFFSPPVQRLVNSVNNSISIATLTAVFFAAFPNMTVVIDSRDTLWGVPIRLIFAVLPLMFLALLFLTVRRSCLYSSIAGLLIGLFISTGSIAVLYYTLSGKELGFLTNVSLFWDAASAKLLFPLIIAMIICALSGLPLFIVLLAITYTAFSQGGGYVDVIPLEMYHILTDSSIAAIPLFTIAGCVLADGSAGKRLMTLMRSTIGSFRGGVVIAPVIVITFFTTFTGASGVTILALGPLLSLILTGNGYTEDEAQSLITSTGSIGILLPPSLAIIIFGVTNIMTVNIFDLFRGAFIPGILLALSMIIIGILRNSSSEPVKAESVPVIKGLKNSMLELLLPVSIIFVYFSGLLSLIQTASFTVLYAVLLEVVIRKDFSWKDACAIILKSIPIAGGVLMIIASAKGLAYFLIDANVPAILTDIVQAHIHSKYLFLLLLNILLLFVGCIMDLYSAILVVSPLIMPIAESFGLHPIHTSVIFLLNLTLGFLTPPIGMDLFIASYTFNKPVVKIVRNILPYLSVQCIVLLLVTYVPILTTILLP